MPGNASEAGKKPARQVAEVNRPTKKQKMSNKGNAASGGKDGGVDVSDLDRSFSNKEWKKLSEETKERIRERRQEKKAKRQVKKVQSKPHDPDETSDDGGNGGHFGSGAYAKKGKKKE